MQDSSQAQTCMTLGRMVLSKWSSNVAPDTSLFNTLVSSFYRQSKGAVGHLYQLTLLAISAAHPPTHQVEGSPVVILLQELVLPFGGHVGHHPRLGLELSLSLLLSHVVDVFNFLSFFFHSAEQQVVQHWHCPL